MQQESNFAHTSYFLDRANLGDKGDVRWAFALAASVNAARMRHEERKQEHELPY